MTDLMGKNTVAGVDVWRPFRGPFERWPQMTDLMIALLAFWLTLLMWSLSSDPSGLALLSLTDIVGFLCAFVGNFALLWRRTHPSQVHAVVLFAALIVFVGPMHDGIVALSFSLYSLGRYETDSRASLIGMLIALVFIAADVLIFSTPSVGGIIAASLVIALWYIGRRLRFRGEYLRLLEERAEHLERLRNDESERAVAAERTRIAREMHDIVAHQLSLMTVQAGAAKTVSDSDPEAAREAMGAVEKAGRHAVSEMRHLLGVLRPANAANALGPQPGIRDLTALVQEVNGAGPVVQLETTGELSGLPTRLDLNAYRIVQEALTNVIKHAGAGVKVDVSVDGRDDSIIIHVTDNGPGGDVSQTSGHGIIGMRERVELLRGTFRAGQRADGGFEIHAILPREPGEQ
ncbi:MAG: sensor histidine kinase [Gammaproteobacteria bacterium]